MATTILSTFHVCSSYANNYENVEELFSLYNKPLFQKTVIIIVILLTVLICIVIINGISSEELVWGHIFYRNDHVKELQWFIVFLVSFFRLLKMRQKSQQE